MTQYLRYPNVARDLITFVAEDAVVRRRYPGPGAEDLRHRDRGRYSRLRGVIGCYFSELVGGTLATQPSSDALQALERRPPATPPTI